MVDDKEIMLSPPLHGGLVKAIVMNNNVSPGCDNYLNKPYGRDIKMESINSCKSFYHHLQVG
jgi:hypothetical protein